MNNPPNYSPAASTKPLVLMSGCLLGEPVRYDGEHKSLGSIRQNLYQQLQIVSVCPEVYAGMGTPREPVRWVRVSDHQGNYKTELQEVNDPAVNKRQMLETGCQQWLQEWQRQYPTTAPTAAILKARSPSCGANTTPLTDSQGKSLGTIDGAFVQALKDRWPHLWILDESQLATNADATWVCHLLRWRQNHSNQPAELLARLLGLNSQQRQHWLNEQLQA